MKLEITTNIPKNALPEQLLRADLADRVTKVASLAAASFLSDHFRARNSAKAGSWGAPSNYWAAVSEAVVPGEPADGQAAVTIKHPGVAWHLFGGTIHAKPGKALAIPMRPENKGVWPSEKFRTRGEAFVWSAKSKGEADGERGAFLARTVNGKLQLEYRLLKKVSKLPDSTVLPAEGELSEVCAAAARQFLNWRTA